MLPSRFGPGQSSAMRKSRMEGKQSLLPIPRRPGSTDRLSTEARRPSAVGHRSSSADPPRATFGGVRLSREASATKLPVNGRSRSQQGDRYAQSMTPLRSSQYSVRPATTPRTPSEDRKNRNWQTSLDRALAFVTIKDQRPLTNVAWQRAECTRVQEALAARGSGGGGGMALIRPLTIARFVDIAGALLGAISRDTKLNTDNYVTKLPHLAKRYLYPGAVSKSWLKSVNTLHAFPHALALLAYLLDLVTHIEMPVLDELMYLEKDELSCLRRDYFLKCWMRFQEPDPQFKDLNEEYLRNLKGLLGNDEERIAELQLVIKNIEACLEDEEEKAALADEARRAERRSCLLGSLRSHRDLRRRDRALYDAQRLRKGDHAETLRELDLEIDKSNAESAQLRAELEQQPLCVAARARLLDDMDYALRVQDSKRSLAEQITKMVLSKETELALWQKKTLASCVEYKQGLIHLSAEFPKLAALAIDEKELMGPECGVSVSQAVAALRECSCALAERRALHARSKAALARQRAALLDETRAKISELKTTIEQEQESLRTVTSQEAAASAAWGQELRELTARADRLAAIQKEYLRVDEELDYWQKMEENWRNKLSSMRDYIESQRVESQRLLRAAIEKRVGLITENIKLWNEKLAL